MSACYNIQNRLLGDGHFWIVAGPCSVESAEQMERIAQSVARAGGQVLRGGAFKPRTSPHDFQGLGVSGLALLKEAAEKYGLLTVSEVMGSEEIPVVSDFVDILQVGSRNMQNFSLLKQLGKSRKPVLLKRGFSATYHEWLMAAEYILEGGNPEVILCERGIRTFEPSLRNTLDLAAVPYLRTLTHLPIIVDPSHATGLRTLVPALSQAVVAVKADGLMIEIHPDPDSSLSDAAQTLSLEAFEALIPVLKKLGSVLGVKV